MSVDLHSILAELGFSPVTSSKDKLISDFFKKSLSVLGTTSYQSLVSYLSSLYKLSENELLKNYKLMEKELIEIFGVGAKIIFENIKSDMIEYISSTNTNSLVNKFLTELSLKPVYAYREPLKNLGPDMNTIVKHIQVVETFESIRELAAREHVVLLYEDEHVKDTILSEFLDYQKDRPFPRGLFSAKLIKLRSVSNMLYDDLPTMKKTDAIKMMSDWISELHTSNTSMYATRIGVEDTWFFENGFNDEILGLERDVGRHLQNNMSMLCTYNVSKITDQKIMKTLIELHNYVVLDNPFEVYKTPI